MTIVGLDFCPPSDAAERAILYHRAYTRITPISLDIYEDNTHIKPSIGHTNIHTHKYTYTHGISQEKKHYQSEYGVTDG